MIPPLLLNVEPHHKVVCQTEEGREERYGQCVYSAEASQYCLFLLRLFDNAIYFKVLFCSFVFLEYT